MGNEFANESFWILLVPDLVSALLGGVLLVYGLIRRHPFTSVIAWLYLGAQGYAWLISLSLAWRDPSAYLGLVSMTLSTGVAFAFAIRLQERSILWGPFQFAFAKTTTKSEFLRQSFFQTAGMWSLFLGAIPISISLLERALGWDSGWRPGSVGMVAAGIVFILCACLGLGAAWEMTQRGEGTPLPAACAKKLVSGGSYRIVRNPMALAGITQGVCVGVWLSSPLTVVYSVIGGVWWELLARGEEEKFLAQTFGEEYDAYRSKVRCWIPFPKRS